MKLCNIEYNSPTSAWHPYRMKMYAELGRNRPTDKQ